MIDSELVSPAPWKSLVRLSKKDSDHTTVAVLLVEVIQIIVTEKELPILVIWLQSVPTSLDVLLLH